MKYPHVQKAEKYARDVVAGKTPACKWVRLACLRHLADRGRQGWRWKFDPARVERKAKFMELFPHTKGRWAAADEHFVLEPFQCFCVMSIYGWVDKNNPKIYRFIRALLMLPRKNGKSETAARIGLDKFANDEEYAAEVFSGATTEKQAMEVFGPAHKMASRSAPFRKFYGVEVMKSNLHIASNGSKFEPVVGKPGDGSSPSCAIIDEYHEHPDDSLVNTMETGMGARERPLSLIITTAGDNLSGPCYALQKELEKILEGVTENERFWGIIYTIDDEDDPFTVEAQRKANPNYGISVSADFLAQKLQEAKQDARKQSIYKIKHLNVWVGAQSAFFNVRGWQQCTKAGITMEDYKGKRLFVGLDLASTRDIAAVVSLLELDGGRFAVFPRCYVPEAALQGNESYQAWSTEGWLTVTDGNMIDYRRIEEDIEAIHSRFGIVELAFDPAYAQRSVQGFMANGINCLEVRPTILNFSAPMKTLDGLIMEGKIEHAGDPCMSWQMSNVVAKLDQKDNVYPNKDRAEAKIDAPVALIMAMNRALVNLGSNQEFQVLFVG